VEQFASAVQTWGAERRVSSSRLIPLGAEPGRNLRELISLAGFFIWTGQVIRDPACLKHKKLTPDRSRQALQLLLWKLEANSPVGQRTAITASIHRIAELLELKLRDLMPLLFAAITGQASSRIGTGCDGRTGPDLHAAFVCVRGLGSYGCSSKKESRPGKAVAVVNAFKFLKICSRKILLDRPGLESLICARPLETGL